MSGEGGWDGTIRRIAARQKGVVTRRQLDAAGVPKHVIDRRVDSGWLIVLYRGVYAVGHLGLSREGELLAAVLAAGEQAVLSHASAVELWELAPVVARIEVTVPTGQTGRGYRSHRSVVPAGERATKSGIPVTSIPRTLFDMASRGRAQLERLHREAELKGLVSKAELEFLLACHSGEPGTRALATVLGDPPTGSPLEKRFRRFLRRHRLRLPDEVNVVMAWGEADCVWHDLRLCVELDGYGVHKSRSAFERDRARDRQALAAGWRIVRVTSRQLDDDPVALRRDLARIGLSDPA